MDVDSFRPPFASCWLGRWLPYGSRLDRHQGTDPHRRFDPQEGLAHGLQRRFSLGQVSERRSELGRDLARLVQALQDPLVGELGKAHPVPVGLELQAHDISGVERDGDGGPGGGDDRYDLDSGDDLYSG